MSAEVISLRNASRQSASGANTANKVQQSDWEESYLLPVAAAANAYSSFSPRSERVIPMVEPTREEIDAKLRASSAEADTKIARMEGKLDLVLSKLDGVNSRFDDVRDDYRSTRANIWVVGLGILVAIIGVAALFPVFFGIGAQVRDMVHAESQAIQHPPNTQK